MRHTMGHTAHARTKAETATLLALTLACYLTAFACVLSVGYAVATLAARDVGRQAAALVAPRDL